MRDRAALNLVVMEQCFEIIGRGDADGLVQHYTDDYVLELPFASADGGRRYEGRETVRARLQAVFRVLRLEITLTEVHPCADPDLVIAEYTSVGTSLPTGARNANRYVGLWWFREGRVSRTREYFNPELWVARKI